MSGRLPIPGDPAPPPDPGVAPGQAALARDLLARAYEAANDAAVLHWDGGSPRGVALRAADATLLGARSLLATRGLDRTDIAAATVLFDRQLVATELVSKACGEALHRALRARRESEETEFATAFYAARVQAAREGAKALLAEARIVLERTIGDVGPPPPDPDLDEDAEGA